MPGVKACVLCGCTEIRACMTEAGPCAWAPFSTPDTPICTGCVETAQAIHDAIELHAKLPF